MVEQGRGVGKIFWHDLHVVGKEIEVARSSKD
jgi:hypothetical protein